MDSEATTKDQEEEVGKESGESWSNNDGSNTYYETWPPANDECRWADCDDPGDPWYIDQHDLTINPVSGEAHRFTLVLLHSCSGGPDDFLPFFHRLNLPFRDRIRVVVPCSPIRAEEHGGWQGEMNSWFEYEDGSDSVKDTAQLLEQRERILKILEQELAHLPNADPRRIVIGGLSQGTALAIDVALWAPFVIGGVLALRGMALSESLSDLKSRPAGASSLQVLAYHGANDRQCPPEAARASYRALVKHGVQVKFIVDNSLGHACARGRQRLCARELSHINDFLRRAWGDIDKCN